jgi:fumarate reductase (CoM/CoB) subunit B
VKLKPNDQDLGTCAFCPNLCLARCPVSLASGDLSLSPWAKQSALWRLQRGVPFSKDTTDPLLMCLGCLACRELCDHGIDVPFNLFAGRALARKNDVELPSLAPVSKEDAWRKLRKLAPEWRVTDDTEALLIVGSDPEIFEPGGVVEQVFEALDAVGDQTLGVTADSVLEAGSIAWEQGQLELAKQQAGQLDGRLSRYRRAYFLFPEELSFLRLGWPMFELESKCKSLPLLDIMHLRMDRLEILKPDQVWAYHDPCHYSRYLDYTRPPRDILLRIFGEPALELSTHHGDSVCCGGGGGMKCWAPDLVERMASSLVEQLDSVGGDKLVVSCPRCYQTIRRKHPTRVETIYHLIALARSGVSDRS